MNDFRTSQSRLITYDGNDNALGDVFTAIDVACAMDSGARIEITHGVEVIDEVAQPFIELFAVNDAEEAT